MIFFFFFAVVFVFVFVFVFVVRLRVSPWLMTVEDGDEMFFFREELGQDI